MGCVEGRVLSFASPRPSVNKSSLPASPNNDSAALLGSGSGRYTGLLREVMGDSRKLKKGWYCRLGLSTLLSGGPVSRCQGPGERGGGMWGQASGGWDEQQTH